MPRKKKMTRKRYEKICKEHTGDMEEFLERLRQSYETDSDGLEWIYELMRFFKKFKDAEEQAVALTIIFNAGFIVGGAEEKKPPPKPKKGLPN
ncbi:hypothetical protein KJ885_03215 [Patescibacteria group bacterium]|nr:hypothetical protein [Patescibacteria group bacterium]